MTTRKPPTPYAYEDLEQLSGYGAWQLKSKHSTRRSRKDRWLILIKTPDCKRGEYTEEIDVHAKTKTDAIKIAQSVLNEEYQSDLRISRVLWQGQCF